MFITSILPFLKSEKPKNLSSQNLQRTCCKRSFKLWLVLGFKLHLITNHAGEIVSFAITKGNISDQNMTTKLSKNLSGFLFGDKGYLSTRTTAELLKNGLHLITKVRQNMKPKPISESNKFLLRRRGIIEKIFGQLKDF